MKTTLFNHKAIGTEEKPLIPNVIFKSLLILVEHRDSDACEYILKNYTLHNQQMQLYEQLKGSIGVGKSDVKINP
jgi:hypothetical protein